MEKPRRDESGSGRILIRALMIGVLFGGVAHGDFTRHSTQTENRRAHLMRTADGEGYFLVSAGSLDQPGDGALYLFQPQADGTVAQKMIPLPDNVSGFDIATVVQNSATLIYNTRTEDQPTAVDYARIDPENGTLEMLGSLPVPEDATSSTIVEEYPSDRLEVVIRCAFEGGRQEYHLSTPEGVFHIADRAFAGGSVPVARIGNKLLISGAIGGGTELFVFDREAEEVIERRALPFESWISHVSPQGAVIFHDSFAFSLEEQRQRRSIEKINPLTLEPDWEKGIFASGMRRSFGRDYFFGHNAGTQLSNGYTAIVFSTTLGFNVLGIFNKEGDLIEEHALPRLSTRPPQVFSDSGKELLYWPRTYYPRRDASGAFLFDESGAFVYRYAPGVVFDPETGVHLHPFEEDVEDRSQPGPTLLSAAIFRDSQSAWRIMAARDQESAIVDETTVEDGDERWLTTPPFMRLVMESPRDQREARGATSDTDGDGLTALQEFAFTGQILGAEQACAPLNRSGVDEIGPFAELGYPRLIGEKGFEAVTESFGSYRASGIRYQVEVYAKGDEEWRELTDADGDTLPATSNDNGTETVWFKFRPQSVAQDSALLFRVRTTLIGGRPPE